MLDGATLHRILADVDPDSGRYSLRIVFGLKIRGNKSVVSGTRAALDGLLSVQRFGMIAVTDSNLDTMRRVANTGRWGATEPEVTVKITERCDLDILIEHLGGRIDMAYVQSTH